jgi:hypothetical protein
MLILLLYNGLHPQVLNDVVESSFEMEVLDKISAAVNFHRTWLIPAMNTSASFNCKNADSFLFWVREAWEFCCD